MLSCVERNVEDSYLAFVKEDLRDLHMFGLILGDILS